MSEPARVPSGNWRQYDKAMVVGMLRTKVPLRSAGGKSSSRVAWSRSKEFAGEDDLQ